MRCRKARRLISQRVDRDLEDADGRVLTDHEQACPACRAFAADVARLAADFASYTVPEVRDGFTARLMARLDATSRPAPSWSRRWWEVLRPAPVALGVAAFACGVMLPLLANGETATADDLVTCESTVSPIEYLNTLTAGETLTEGSVEDRLLDLWPEAEE